MDGKSKQNKAKLPPPLTPCKLKKTKNKTKQKTKQAKKKANKTIMSMSNVHAKRKDQANTKPTHTYTRACAR